MQACFAQLFYAINAKHHYIILFMAIGDHPPHAILSHYGKVSDPAKEVKNTKERLLRALRGLAESLGYHSDDLLEE